MSVQIRRRGDTTVAHEGFIGADREITIDTDKHTVVVHDGETAGGYPLLRDDLSNLLLLSRPDQVVAKNKLGLYHYAFLAGHRYLTFTTCTGGSVIKIIGQTGAQKTSCFSLEFFAKNTGHLCSPINLHTESTVVIRGVQVKDIENKFVIDFGEIIADRNVVILTTNHITDWEWTNVEPPIDAAGYKVFPKAMITLDNVGQIIPTPLSSFPGCLRCDGSQVSRTTYAALFARIGTTFGSGNGSTTFHLPDYRGYFLRGLGGNSASNFSTLQAESVPNITGWEVGNRDVTYYGGAFQKTSGNNCRVNASSANSYNDAAINFNANRSSGAYGRRNEVAPANYAVNFFIRF